MDLAQFLEALDRGSLKEALADLEYISRRMDEPGNLMTMYNVKQLIRKATEELKRIIVLLEEEKKE